MNPFFLSFTVLIGSFVLNAQQCTDEKKTKAMLTYQEGLKLATVKLNQVSKDSPEYIIWQEKTVVKDYGWIFRPESKKFILTGSRGARVPGISIILVNKFDSTCIMAPSSVSPQIFIQDYEKKRAGQ